MPVEQEVSQPEEEVEEDCLIDEFLQLKQETEKVLHHEPRNVEELFSVFQQWAMLPRAMVPNEFQIADPMDALFRLYLQQTSSMFVSDDPYLERQKTRMLNIILRQWKWDLLRSSSVEVSRRSQKQRQKQQWPARDDPNESADASSSSSSTTSSSQHLRKVAIQNAEALFQYCCSSNTNRSSSPSSVLVHPDLETYHSLMNLSLTMSHVSLTYVIQAENYLRLMMSLPEQEMDTFVLLPNNNDFYCNLHGEQQPFTFDTRSFNNVLHGYSRRRQESSGQFAAEAASRSCRLLQEMHELSSSADCHYSCNVRPNLTTYKFVLVALSRSPEDDAPKKCEELLQTMQNLAAAGYQSSEDCDANNTNNTSNNNLSSTSGNSMEPDIACYNTVLHAWWRRNTVAAAERCTHIVQRMIQLHQDGYIRAKPNSFTFDACIRAWARIEENEAPLDVAERAESILMRMIAYSNATTRTISPTATDDLLERQNVDAACEYCLPSTASFNNVISLWTKARHQEDHLERAERILDMLLQEYKSGNNAHARPTSNSFFSIMIAYMRQGRKRHSVGGFVHAERVYRKMEKVDIIPSEARHHALQATMEMLASYSQENHRVARHQQQELNDITTTIFNHLCRNGFLTNRVLNILKQVVSPNVYMTLLKVQTKNAKFSIGTLPKEWSCNIIDDQKKNNLTKI